MIQRECRTYPFCPLAETLSWQTSLAIESQLPAYIDSSGAGRKAVGTQALYCR